MYNVRKLGFSMTRKLCLSILSALLLFHVLIVSGMIPYTIVWAGRLNSWEDMLFFESISLALNLCFLGMVFWRSETPGSRFIEGIQRILMLCIALLFGLNTLGNLTAITPLEKYVFTPLTFVLSLLFLRLSLKATTSPTGS